MQKLTNEKKEPLSTKSQITFPVIICLLALSCLAYFFIASPSPLSLAPVSEMIPDRAVVDSNGNSQLESTVYFIRQSFVSIPNFSLSFPYTTYLIVMGGSILLLLVGLKEWGQFNKRYLVGGMLTWAIVIILTNQFAEWNEILLIIADQIQVLGIVILALSTLFISSAIPRLLFQVGHSNTLAQSKKNWLIFYGFYLVNLILTYGKTYLGWDIQFAIPPICLIASAWIAYAFQVSNLTVLLRAGLGLISLSTLFLFLMTGNDAGLNALQHWSLISFTIMLVLFPLFVISNFRTPISQNLPVYKIIHKAPLVDLRIIYIGVSILGAAWVFAKNGSVWHQFQAALFNERGDIALMSHDKQGAEFAYQQAMIHSKLNGKSNLSLAAMALDVNDSESAAYYLNTANVKHAEPLHYIALAAIYQQAEKSFEALFTLQQAHQKFPNSMEVATQLAHQFEKLQTADSARHYYHKAWLLAPDHPISQGNYLYSTQQIKLEFEESEDPAIQANRIAIALKKGNQYVPEYQDIKTKPGNDLRVWAKLYNFNLWAKSQADLIPSDWKKDPEVINTFPEINLLDAWQDYHHGKCIQALQKVNLLISADSTARTEGLQQILGFWKASLLLPQVCPSIKNTEDAQRALEKYPFQIEVLNKSLQILNKSNKGKQGYDAALSALQWNENIPVYYLIFAMQAYEIGEITYGNDARDALQKLSPTTYDANKTTLSAARLKALQRQKFE